MLKLKVNDRVVCDLCKKKCDLADCYVFDKVLGQYHCHDCFVSEYDVLEEVEVDENKQIYKDKSVGHKKKGVDTV
jgi:hypothetical protein